MVVYQRLNSNFFNLQDIIHEERQINSRVMRHPELNEIGPGPKPISRPGPNEAHSEEYYTG